MPIPMRMNRFFKRAGNTAAAVNIQRDCYTMATADGFEAEIVFYGEIVPARPIDWWTGEPIPGNYIVLDEFLEDLKAISGAKHILMRIDSIGGDSEASITIHNRLRELPAKKTARIDGVAMSGGALIMCAADTIEVNPSSQVMVHKCWSVLWGAYDSDDLRVTLNYLEGTDKSQIAIFKRKTGINSDELLTMMSKTPVLVGQEIIDAGFADKLLDSDEEEEKPEISASADKRLLYVNGRSLHLPPSAGLPENIPMVSAATIVTLAAGEANKNQPSTDGGQEGGPLMAKNLEELRAENPELAKQLVAEAQAAASADTAAAAEKERRRIEEIDSIANLYDDATVREAKYGEKSCTAQEMAFRAAQSAAKQGKKFIADITDDAQASGTNGVAATPGEEDEGKPLTPEQRMAQGRADAKKTLNREDK